MNQYYGIAPDDERMAPYWALAEELDIPVGIHLGEGLPGATFTVRPKYLGRLVQHAAAARTDWLCPPAEYEARDYAQAPAA